MAVLVFQGCGDVSRNMLVECSIQVDVQRLHPEADAQYRLLFSKGVCKNLPVRFVPLPVNDFDFGVAWLSIVSRVHVAGAPAEHESIQALRELLYDTRN